MALAPRVSVLIAALALAVVCAAEDAELVKSHLKSSTSVLFFDDFDGSDWSERWKHSTADKYTGRFTTAQASRGARGAQPQPCTQCVDRFKRSIAIPYAPYTHDVTLQRCHPQAKDWTDAGLKVGWPRRVNKQVN